MISRTQFKKESETDINDERDHPTPSTTNVRDAIANLFAEAEEEPSSEKN